jgi:hypothetical protein
MYRLISFVFLSFINLGTVSGEEINRNKTHTITLSSGEYVVVSEGFGEPRSIGSYSLRIYSVLNPKYPYDNFVAGVILAREGVIEKVMAYDLDKDGSDEIVVIVRNVGTGSYLSVKAIKYDGKSISVLLALDGLNKDANPIQSLQSAFNDTSGPTWIGH